MQIETKTQNYESKRKLSPIKAVFDSGENEALCLLRGKSTVGSNTRVKG